MTESKFLNWLKKIVDLLNSLFEESFEPCIHLSSPLYCISHWKKIMIKKQITQWASIKRNDYFFIFRLIRNTSTLHYLTLTAAHGNFSNNLKYSFQSNVQNPYIRHSLQNNGSKIFYLKFFFIWHALFCSDYPVK